MDNNRWYSLACMIRSILISVILGIPFSEPPRIPMPFHFWKPLPRFSTWSRTLSHIPCRNRLSSSPYIHYKRFRSAAAISRPLEWIDREKWNRPLSLSFWSQREAVGASVVCALSSNLGCALRLTNSATTNHTYEFYHKAPAATISRPY